MIRSLWHAMCPCCGTPLTKEQKEDVFACNHCGWEAEDARNA